MVFFTCNACGASLKKNQVEKHYQSECRNCSSLSCMDCGVDFHGDSYAEHTKCISEAEKYQGAMYKEGTNKGDKKQEEWLERARKAIEGAKVSKRLAGILERIVEFPNIPRKKKKFENFVRNSCHVRDQKTLDDIWSVFNEPPQVQVEQGTKVISSQDSSEQGTKVVSSQDTALSESEEMVAIEQVCVREEGKKKKKGGKQVEQVLLNASGDEENSEVATKTKKKKQVELNNALSEVATKKSKKSKRCLEEALECEVAQKKKKTMRDEDEGLSRKHLKRKKKL